MKDLIERETAIEYIRAQRQRQFDGMTIEQMMIKIIGEVPSAQPERKTGRWVEVNDSYNRISGRCSVCGWESHMYEDDVVGMNYCPHCGAKMEVEHE